VPKFSKAHINRTCDHELVSITKAADLLGKDRQTIVRAMRGIEPDGVEMKQPRYRLATIMRALETPKAEGPRSQEAGLTEARRTGTRAGIGSRAPMQMSKQEIEQSSGFQVHPNGKIELLSELETCDIIVRAINAAVARGLGVGEQCFEHDWHL
jgi:hypothetical protein